MTVSYSAKVATASFGRFFKLLKRWRGSIYKILFKEFAVFATAYFTISFIYMFALTEDQKRYFEHLAEYCAKFNDLIPIVFVLGFYVNHVAGLWWDKFRTLPWPGRTAMLVSAHLHGHDERARLMRRTIMRYVCLSYVLTMSTICPPVKKRFPTLQHMADAGLLLPNEAKVLTNLKTSYNKFFVPLIWSSSLVSRARKEGRIKDDFAVNSIIGELNDYRTKSFQLLNFNWISLPLVYTQVVTIAVHTFFLTCLLARQRLDSGLLCLDVANLIDVETDAKLDLFLYLCFQKVAETMLNPFGDDDDDFDINYLIDRHLKVSYLVVDEMHSEHPELIKDQYWDTTDFDLPHTQESKRYHHTEETQAAAADVEIPLFIPGSMTLTNSLTCINEEFEEGGDDNLCDLPPHSQQSKYILTRGSHHRLHQPIKSPSVWKSVKRSLSRQNSASSSRRSSLITDRILHKRVTSHESLRGAGVTRGLGTEVGVLGAKTASEIGGPNEVRIPMERLESTGSYMGDHHQDELMFHMSDVESEDGQECRLVQDNRATRNNNKTSNNRNNNKNNSNIGRSVSRDSEAESLFSADVRTRASHSKTQPSHSQGIDVDEFAGLSLIAEDSPELCDETKRDWSHEPPAEQQVNLETNQKSAAQQQQLLLSTINQTSAPQDQSSLFDQQRFTDHQPDPASQDNLSAAESHFQNPIAHGMAKTEQHKQKSPVTTSSHTLGPTEPTLQNYNSTVQSSQTEAQYSPSDKPQSPEAQKQSPEVLRPSRTTLQQSSTAHQYSPVTGQPHRHSSSRLRRSVSPPSCHSRSSAPESSLFNDDELQEKIRDNLKIMRQESLKSVHSMNHLNNDIR